MTSTNSTTIPTRLTQCVAATAFLFGVAFGATPIASAEPREWDIQRYDACIERGEGVIKCCYISDGDLADDGADGLKCVAPPALESQPGQTVAPPVLENPPGQTVAPPVITVPRGPNSGTIG